MLSLSLASRVSLCRNSIQFNYNVARDNDSAQQERSKTPCTKQRRAIHASRNPAPSEHTPHATRSDVVASGWELGRTNVYCRGLPDRGPQQQDRAPIPASAAPPCGRTSPVAQQARTGSCRLDPPIAHTHSLSAPRAPPRVARAPCARAPPPSHACAATRLRPPVAAAASPATPPATAPAAPALRIGDAHISAGRPRFLRAMV